MDQFEAQISLLPEYLGAHIAISLAALATGIVVSIPAALLALRIRWWRDLSLLTASVVQTIPGLALLALMVPLLGQIGFLPAFLALVLYSILPVLRNTVTGILGVDRAVLEAARGIGMTSGEILTRVEVPLALPVIVAGIRTSAVWIVGTATLATPVGATSLGNYIFSGLQTRNFLSVTVGCVAAALLAIFFDQVIRMYELAARERSRRYFAAASAGVILLIAGALLPGWPTGAPKGEVIIGSKPFTEQYILADALKTKLEENGFSAVVKSGLGSTILFEALASGEVDCYIDYSGTIWSTNMKRDSLPSRDRILEEMTGWLQENASITCIGPLGFENTYSLAMTESEAERYGIRSITDLAAHAPGIRLGSDYEFLVRPEWEALKAAYGLEFKDLRTLDPTLMYTAISRGQVEVISAYSTDGRVSALDLRVLEDDREVLPPYDAVLLLSEKASGDDRLRRSLDLFVGQIGDELMRQANEMVDVKRQPVEAAAGFLLISLDETEQ